MEGIIRLVIFMDDDLADIVTLNPERKVDVQVGVAENDFEMLNTAFEKSRVKNIIFSRNFFCANLGFSMAKTVGSTSMKMDKEMSLIFSPE